MRSRDYLWPYRRMLLKHFAKVLEEVLAEDVLFNVVRVEHGGEEASHLFRFGRQIYGLAWRRCGM